LHASEIPPAKPGVFIEEGGVNMWRAVIVVGIVFALPAYACIVVGARSEDNRAGGN